MKRRDFGRLALVAIGLVAANKAFAAQDAIYTGLVPGVGAGGYDPVSYFEDGGPRMGDPAKSTTWNGAEWRFASAENLAAFKAAPEKYAPQYGGYCAYAVSKGATAKGDPEIFSIVDGKVYFNLSQGVQASWRQDIPGNIAAANANWPRVLE